MNSRLRATLFLVLFAAIAAGAAAVGLRAEGPDGDETAHWAYQPVRRPSLPAVRDTGWVRTPVDHFILAGIERAGLKPSEQADREHLVRRLTFDLTGLPPTPDDVRRFVEDRSPDAYERLVDRLLASPRFGERMAVVWLDLARYADTHGYHIDSHRDMWRWRDWVIDSFNRNQPFDRFTIEQLAGDLLPEPTLAQRIATGFNRNNMVNFEGGAIAEEYRTEYVMDRVATTGTVWLGQTLACARCHDHKYDPISQQDFYRLFAYFNNLPEEGLDGRTGNAVPFLPAPTDEQQRRLALFERRIAEVQGAMDVRGSQVDEPLHEWQQRLAQGAARLADPPGDMQLHFRLDEQDGVRVRDDGPDARHGEVLGSPIWIPGKFGGALLGDGATRVEVANASPLERDQPFTLSAWVFPTTRDRMLLLGRSDDGDPARGYQLLLDDARVHLYLVHQWPDNALHVHTDQVLVTNRWQHVLVTYDGSSRSEGASIYVDGVLQQLERPQDSLSDSIQSDAPLTLAGRAGRHALRGMLDDVRVYSRRLNESEAGLLAGTDPIRDIVAVPAERRTAEQRDVLLRYFLENEDSQYKRLQQQLAEWRRRKAELEDAVVTTMVMQEMEQPRETFFLERGDYRSAKHQVAPGTPGFLPPLPDDAPPNRLGFARWLVDPANPLTARVAVNRYWQLLFGTGLVRTAEDFGTRGEAPSHPELLDWLADEFVRGGWDRKQLLRLLVCSATYRQSSRVEPAVREADPGNRLFSRMPRQRLDAEMIRDQALAISGLLDNRLGGISVYPYQPEGLWEEVSFNPRDFTAQRYAQSRGADLYRRSVYTFWKRAVPPPAMSLFDAPDREICTARRPRTNTPLQALVLMNDITYVEAARVFAERILEEGGADDRERLRYAFRWATSREPNAAELAVLTNTLDKQLADFQQDAVAARKLLAVGAAPVYAKHDPAQLAAWTTIASMLLNLDETISKH